MSKPTVFLKKFKVKIEEYCYNSTFFLLEIKESNIENAGYGLFTKEDIKKGTIIGYYTGIVTNDESKLSDYSFEIDDEWFIDDYNFPRGYIAMVNDPINSKFKSNCSFFLEYINPKTKKEYKHPKEYKIYLQADKNIKSGTELFASYGEGYWQSR